MEPEHTRGNATALPQNVLKGSSMVFKRRPSRYFNVSAISLSMTYMQTSLAPLWVYRKLLHRLVIRNVKPGGKPGHADSQRVYCKITQKASGMNGPTILSGSQHLFPRHTKQIANPLNDRLQIRIFVPKMMFPVQGFRCMSPYRLNEITVSRNQFAPPWQGRSPGNAA